MISQVSTEDILITTFDHYNGKYLNESAIIHEAHIELEVRIVATGACHYFELQQKRDTKLQSEEVSDVEDAESLLMTPAKAKSVRLISLRHQV